MTAILLSVKPEYAEGLLAGTKTAEVRRRFPTQPAGATLYVYASSPQCAVVGTLILDDIERPPAGRVWELYKKVIQIRRGPLDEYLRDVEEAAILRVSEPRRWDTPLPLADLRALVGLQPPQSFRYVDAAQQCILETWDTNETVTRIRTLARSTG